MLVSASFSVRISLKFSQDMVSIGHASIWHHLCKCELQCQLLLLFGSLGLGLLFPTFFVFIVFVIFFWLRRLLVFSRSRWVQYRFDLSLVCDN